MNVSHNDELCELCVKGIQGGSRLSGVFRDQAGNDTDLLNLSEDLFPRRLTLLA